MKSFFVKYGHVLANVLSFGMVYLLKQMAKKKRVFTFDVDKDGVTDVTITLGDTAGISGTKKSA